MDKKKCRVNTEVFREILQICPRLPNQDFVELPLEEDLLTFIKELVTLCIFGKTTGLDRLRESRAQIMWAMYNKMNVDYVALLREDFMINLHTVRDDTLLRTLKFVSKIEDYQKYRALIPDGIINDDVKSASLMFIYFFAYELYLNLLSRNINPSASQQAALDNSLVALEKRLKIKRCNAKIAFTKPKKEETYQVTLEALKMSPCYPAFQRTAEVPEYYKH
nr:hypothetical protein [Tanacetum cinerariifolium]